MNIKNNIYYATTTDNEGHGYQYRIIRNNNTYMVQQLISVKGFHNWQDIDIDPNIKLSSIGEVINYIYNNIENIGSIGMTRKKVLKK